MSAPFPGVRGRKDWAPGATDSAVALGITPVGVVDSWLEKPMYRYLRGALDGVEHAHLRDLSQRLSQRGESVLEYWRRTGRDLIQVSVDDGPDGPRAAQGGWRATASGRQLDRPPTTERDSLS